MSSDVERFAVTYRELGRAMAAMSRAFIDLDAARPPVTPIAGLHRLGELLRPPATPIVTDPDPEAAP